MENGEIWVQNRRDLNNFQIKKYLFLPIQHSSFLFIRVIRVIRFIRVLRI